ncbi:MAG TPA: hypothetical protein VH372_06720, partial [Actinospica sp.]|nr:hypothetical protein [Actinospica sp.]
MALWDARAGAERAVRLGARRIRPCTPFHNGLLSSRIRLMRQWNPAEADSAVGRALGAVRAVTALSGLKVVLTLEQLAAYVGEQESRLDEGLRAGPVAGSQVERVVQGSYVGFRHPDAAWTMLPSRMAAAREGAEFARWFAEWLARREPGRREEARAAAKAVAAAARATGKKALGDRIDGMFRRSRREGRGGRVGRVGCDGSGGAAGPDAAAAVTSSTDDPIASLPSAPPALAASSSAASASSAAYVPSAASVSRLPAKTTAGILAGTAMLIVGAVAGVAVLTETGAVANGARSRAPTSASSDGASPASPGTAASPAASGSAADPTG